MTEPHPPTAIPDTQPEAAEDTAETQETEVASFVDAGVDEHNEADAPEEAAAPAAAAGDEPGDASVAGADGADAPDEVAGSGVAADSEAPVASDYVGVDSEGPVEATAVGDEQGDVPADEDFLEPGQTEVPVGDEVVIDDETMRRAIEAILMVTDEPLPVLTLARAVGRPTGDVAEALAALADEYTEQGRGFDLREVGGGWRYYTRVDAAPYVERFVLDGQQARLTQAALETLAVVAYKQPVSRARVSAIRGVNVDGVMRTLISRGLVEEAGADTESQATLYRTTSYFLERMGMQSLDDLPELAPYLPDMDDIEDELAAQTIPSAAPEENTPTDVTTQPEPPDDEPTEDEPIEDQPIEDEPIEDQPTEDQPTEDQPTADEPAEDETGVDGDLTTGEPVELDVEHEPGDLEPSEEVEPAESNADEVGAGEYSVFGDRRHDG